MKYVYQVKERIYLECETKVPYYGIVFYTSLKKAQDDFNVRVENYQQGSTILYQDEYGTTCYTKEITMKKGNVLYDVILEKHEVY